MSTLDVGILHPGAMGISVAASALRTGHNVYWVSEGRSEETRARAEEQRLLDAGTLDEICRVADAIISVCPPHAAETVARAVLDCGFSGLYLDANAIAPERAVRMGEAVSAAGATYVDGGIIGGPAWEPGHTWLYLSGGEATAAAALFAGGPLETAVLGEEIGRASALKMCFAAYTKGSTALLAAILAAAEGLGVRGDLYRQWSRHDPGFVEQTERRATRVTAKAWRFAGEMDEIAATFAAVGLPAGFHHAAGDLYTRLAHFKDAPETPPLANVLAALRAPLESESTEETPDAP